MIYQKMFILYSIYNHQSAHCCLHQGFQAAPYLAFPFSFDFSFDFFFFLSFYYSSSSSSSPSSSSSAQSSSPSCSTPKQYYKLYGNIQSTSTPPNSKSLSSAYLFFNSSSLASTSFTVGASKFLKKLKNDFASTVLVITLCCPVFLFFCFFFTYFTVRFFPFHSITEASVFTASSFFKKNFFVSCLLFIKSFSAKSKTIVKLSVPYQSTTLMFSIAFKRGSSSGPICCLIRLEFPKTLNQQSGSFRAPKFSLTFSIYSLVKYLSKSLSSASVMCLLPWTILATFQRIGASSFKQLFQRAFVYSVILSQIYLIFLYLLQIARALIFSGSGNY